MVVTQYFLIGNATIPSSWVALLSAFIVAFILVRLRFGKHMADVLVDAVFYFILIWKLSVILTQFEHVIKSPLSILYFNGGKVGIVLGLLGAALKIFFTMKKRQSERKDCQALFVGAVIIQAVYQIVMVLVNDSTLIIKIVTIVVFSVFTLFVWLMVEKGQFSQIQLPVLLIAVHFLVAAFQSVSLLSILPSVILSLFFSFMTYDKKVIEPEGTL